MKKKTKLLLFLLVIANGVIAQKHEPASVVIIMADQLRFDVLGDRTPNIIALMRDGVSFKNAYCASPICVPSRGAFFTGRYPNRTGSLINGWEEDDESFAVVKAGIPNLYSVMEGKWDSWHVGKQHFLTEEKIDEDPQSRTKWITQKDYTEWMRARGVPKPGGPMFKAMVPEMVSGTSTHARTYSIPAVAAYEGGTENFLDHYVASEALTAIKDRNKRKPLLLNVMFLAPHPPFHIPEPYFSMFNDVDLSLPDNVGMWYTGQSPLQLYNLTGFLGSRYNRKEWRSIWKKYMGLVTLLDDEIGRIVEALKKEGLYDKSIIIFTADHGEMLGSHSLWQKMCMYEESARVPLIIKFPRDFKTAVAETSVPVSLVDVFPTLLDFNALRIPGEADGQSLLPMVLSQNNHRPPTPVFIQYDGNGSLGNFQRCVVSGEFKLIVDIFKDEIFLELYKISEDPQEKVNLAFQKNFREKTLELLESIKAHMGGTGDRMTLPENVYEDFLNRYQHILKK